MRKSQRLNERILVIDDDPDLVELIGLTLEARGYQVFSAASSMEGLQKVKEINPDLIIAGLRYALHTTRSICPRTISWRSH